MSTREDDRNARILWQLILWLIVVPALVNFVMYLFR